METKLNALNKIGLDNMITRHVLEMMGMSGYLGTREFREFAFKYAVLPNYKFVSDKLEHLE